MNRRESELRADLHLQQRAATAQAARLSGEILRLQRDRDAKAVALQEVLATVDASCLQPAGCRAALRVAELVHEVVVVPEGASVERVLREHIQTLADRAQLLGAVVEAARVVDADARSAVALGKDVKLTPWMAELRDRLVVLDSADDNR